MLTAGDQLGPYRIVSLLGAGGMGEVYQARDERLAREVAIKILPAELSSNPDRLSRFQQEARATGALNHPNILSVYDIGSDKGAPYVVSELLEGETLRSRMGNTPLPLRKAIDFGRQIATGLAAAHDKGVVHRDLKPENIFVTREGRVKILDFGLAKLTEVFADDGAATARRDTDPGVVMGTAGYMSPEQVRGQPVDHRSDIFSFGAILYEMLIGARAFSRDSSVETMNAILKEDPPALETTGERFSPAVARILRHCLEKNREERFQSAGDLAFDLEALTETSASSAARKGIQGRISRRVSLPLAAALALLALALGVAIGRWALPRAARRPPSIAYLTFSGADAEPAASPDGKTVAFTSTRDGASRIWIKQISGGEEVPLTKGPDANPRFSTDGSFILFTRLEEGRVSLFKVPVVGGEARRVIRWAMDGDLSPDGRWITFIRPIGEGPTFKLFVARADGSEERELFSSITSLVQLPRFSLDGSRIAVTLNSFGATVTGSIMIFDLKGKREKTITAPRSQFTNAVWIDDQTIAYGKANTVTRFSGAPGEILVHDLLSGDTEVLMTLPSLGSVLDRAPGGRLLIDNPMSSQQLRRFPLDGATQPAWLTRGFSTDRQPAFSPDGEWVTFSSDRGGNLDLWKISLRDGSVRRITDDEADDWDPAFTPDGKRLVWSSNRSGHFEIWTAEADGSGARQVSRDGFDAENPTVTPDGRVVYASANPKGMGMGIWRVNLDGSNAQRIVSGVAIHPEVSPDGEYVVFHRDSSESVAVLVARVSDGKIFPIATGLVSGQSVGRPRWMPDGSGVAFVVFAPTGSSGVAAAPPTMGIMTQKFQPGRDTTASRRRLAGFDPDRPSESFGIAPDGKSVVVSEQQSLKTLMMAEGMEELDRK